MRLNPLPPANSRRPFRFRRLWKFDATRLRRSLAPRRLWLREVVRATREGLSMKRTIPAAVAAVLVLWLGYFLGYHHGLQEERRAWEATREVSLVSVTNRGIITQSTRWSYMNPHYIPLYFVAEPTGRGAKTVMNAPDPRTYRQYEHSSP